MHPSIAVVVTCYNKGPCVEAALASLAAQVAAPREVVFVDDGSTDDSVARAEAFAASHPALPLRILRQPNSGQPAHARNAGIATVTSDVVICLDADDVLSPLHLEAVAHAFAADPGLGLVYPDGIAFGQGAPRGWQSQEWDPARLAQTNLCPCVTAFRRRIWETVGGYRTNVRGYEDWDFWIAAGAIGERGLRLPLPLFHYRELESGVFASTHARDLVLRASIVLNNPGCYGEPTRALARAIVDGAPFDPMPVWRELDEILRVGCTTAAHRAAAADLAWAAEAVAAGTASATLETLQRRQPMDAATARRVGALLHAGGDTARGLATMLLAWSATTRSGGATAAADAAPPRSPAPPPAPVPATASGRPAVIAPPLAPGATRPRILCWMPYGQWNLHALQEMTVLHGARWRGAEVRYVLCDGVFKACDMHWAAVRPRTAGACTVCRRIQDTQADGLRMPHEWLGDHLAPADRAIAAEWVASLPADALRTARWLDWEIGTWSVGSVHSQFRTNVVDATDPVHERSLREHLEASLLTAFAIDRVVREWRPDALLLFNGRMAVQRTALEVARAAGVRVLVHERGWLPESLFLMENADVCSSAGFVEAWTRWHDRPLTAAEHARTEQWLLDRVHGRNLNWLAYSPPPGAREEVATRLGLRAGAPLYVVFTSSEDEVASSSDATSVFGDQPGWLRATAAWAAAHPDIDMVLRIHPNTGGARSMGRNAAQLAWFDAFTATLPPNVRVVRPDDDVSSYTLIDMATTTLAYLSTIALESACLGRRAFVAATAFMSGCGFTDEVRSPDDYAALLDGYRTPEPTEAALHRRTLAWRFAYMLFFRYNRVLPQVTQPDFTSARLAYDTLDALRPGVDASLDHVVSVLLDGAPICPDPDPAEPRDAAEERRRHAAASVAETAVAA